MQKHLIVFLFVFFVGIGGGFASWFGYTNLSFFDGTITGNTMSMDITVGTGLSGFWINIYNPTQELQGLKLSFASQVQTLDGKASCDMISGAAFANNFLWSTGNFSVDSGIMETKRIDFNFPVCTSGIFYACAIQLAPTEENIGSFDVVAGKVNFMTFKIAPSVDCNPVSVKVFPGSRPSENFTNIGQVRFYDQSDVLQYSGVVDTNQFGTGSLQEFVSPGIYYVIYKGQSQLASYLSGVEVTQGGEILLDFTTGSNLYNTQNKSISQNDGYQYQIAGDLKNILGQYDFMINGNDIAILTTDGFIDSGVPVLDPKNLNADSAINVSDISIIGINFELTDSFFSSNIFNW